MELKNKTWQVSILLKLLCIFFIVLIPLYTISLLINSWGAARIRDEISKSVMSKNHFYLNTLENEVRQIKKRQLQYLQNENLQMLSITPQVLSDFEKVVMINDLKDRLLDIKYSHNYILTNRITFPSLNRAVSSERTNESILEDEYSVLRKRAGNASTPLLYWAGRLFLAEFFPSLGIKEGQDPMFLCSTELSMAELEKTLSQSTDIEGSGFLLMDRDKEWVISNTRDEEIIAEVGQLVNNNTQNDVPFTDTMTVKGMKYIITCEMSDYLGTYLAAFIPEEDIMGPLQDYRTWFLFLSLVSIFVIIFFSFSIYRTIHKPLYKLVKSFKKVDEGVLDISIKHSGNDEFRFLYEHFNIMVEKFKDLIHQVYEEKILVQRAELKHLQSQINPHFLYNSFFVLYRVAKNHDYDKVCRLTQLLGEYFQFITRSGSDEIPLHTEINHARIYAEIQSMRFSSRIQVEFDELIPDFGELLVPRLILQPLIENAYEHGLNNKMKDGRIHIGFEEFEDRLVICVEDNGEELMDANLEHMAEKLQNERGEAESTGTINVHRRLKLKFGSDSGLKVFRSSLGGLRVDVNIFKGLK